MESFFAVGLLSVHVLCMNVAAAGPLLCVALDTRAARGDPAAEKAARWLSRQSCWLALFGAGLGLVQGWLRWNAEYQHVLQHFSTRIHWGIVEFLFSLVLMGGYAFWLSCIPRASLAARWLRSLLAVLAATNLLYHFPTLFTLIAQAAAGRIDPDTVDSATFRRLIMQSEVLALTTHFALASIAVSGVALIGFAIGRRVEDNQRPQLAAFGARAALAATALQLPVGAWLLLSFPPRSQQALLGGDPLGSGVLVLSVLAAFGMLHPLAALAFGDFSRRQAIRAMQFLLFVVVAMCAVLQRTNG